jgi:cell wall-associated NlpC family hydrolase
MTDHPDRLAGRREPARLSPQALGDLVAGLIGRPYVADGCRPEHGFYCWGLVRYLYGTQGIELPADIHQASALFRRVPPPYQAWDVLVFRLVGSQERHVGVAISDRWFVHCSLATGGVARSERTRLLWRSALRYGVRYVACS